MKCMLLISSVMTVFGLSQIQDASVASAQGFDNYNVRIAMHVTPHFVPTSKQFPTLCSASPMATDGWDCSNFTTAFSINDFPGPDTYIVAA